jgi:4-hydroxyphenylpyruvate dioxygenase
LRKEIRDAQQKRDALFKTALDATEELHQAAGEYNTARERSEQLTKQVAGMTTVMREKGIDFLDTPETYFDVIDQRIPDHGEDVARLQRNKILIDADPETKQRKLLQIFTKNAFGPIFFEIIQRKGNEGFGEGNFQALFESIERDQMKRGFL